MIWRRIIGIPAEVDALKAMQDDLKSGQLADYQLKKLQLQREIDKVTAYPDGMIVRTLTGNMAPADWLTDATADMVEIDAQIAVLS